MRYNKRGSIFFGLAIGIVVYIFGVLLIPFIMDDVTTFRDAMSCSDTTISGGTMLSCILADAMIPYLIFFFISLALGFVVGATK